ncbi:MAG: hypothetical protein D3922_14050 [Candidatus Electrothrix sp. AR1]|nr:hypothetical protein [Candidatus Electrothrix sp. AR1]
MPIEIKELHIRVAVNTPTGEQATGAFGSSSVSGSSIALDKEGKDALVAECVEQVMQILQNKQER